MTICVACGITSSFLEPSMLFSMSCGLWLVMWLLWPHHSNPNPSSKIKMPWNESKRKERMRKENRKTKFTSCGLNIAKLTVFLYLIQSVLFLDIWYTDRFLLYSLFYQTLKYLVILTYLVYLYQSSSTIETNFSIIVSKISQL